MLIQISQPISAEEWAFLQLALSDDDAILISGKACHLACVQPPLAVTAFVDAADVAKLGAQTHSDWQTIDTQGWLKLTLEHEKVVSWS